jgi:cysteine desulfurase/selenocysteine lyase
MTDSAQSLRSLRALFPVLETKAHGKPLIYFDNAATAQVPTVVEQAVADFTRTYRANVNRGVHYLSQKATDAHEAARERIKRFLNAAQSEEIIFTRGTTESINLVAQTWGRQNIRPGDAILLSAIEHHANIVPWQILAQEKDAHLLVIPVDDQGVLDQAAFEELLGKKPKLLALAHVSNALGTINPVKEMIAKAHAHGVPVLLDGAQSIPHIKVDVQDLDCDFLAFSGHKIHAPTGIGVLYGKRTLLEAMPVWQGGGDMIASVTFEKTTYNELPWKFEAGTPHIEGAIGLGAAIDFVESVGLDRIAQREQELLDYITPRLLEIPGLRILGTAPHKVAVLSFVIEGIHPYDTGVLLDQLGIAVRTGHHCAQPVMDRFGVPGTVRASLAFYNTEEEIDALVGGLQRVREMLK